MFRQSRGEKTTSARSLLATWGRHLMLLGLLLLAFLVTAALALLGANRGELLKRAVILHLRFALGREVSLGGINVDLHGRISLTDLTIQHQHDARSFFSARRIDIRFDPQAMLRLPFRPVSAISAIDVEHPYLDLARASDGKWNFQDIINKPTKPSPDRFSGAIRLHHGEILYRDQRGFVGKPLDERLSDVELRVSRASDVAMPFAFSAQPRTGHARRLQVNGVLDMANRRLEGTLLHEEFDLTLLRKLLPASFHQFLSADRGTADGRWQVALDFKDKITFTLTGVADLHDVEGTLRLDKPRPFRVASGQVAMTNDAVELIGITGSLGGIPVTADGTLSGPGYATIALQARTAGAPMTRLVQIIPGLSDVDATWGGTVTGWVRVVGRMPNVEVTGHVAGPAVTLDKAAVSALAGDFRFSGDAIAFTHVTGQGFGGSFHGTAWSSVGKQPVFLFTGDAEEIDTHDIVTRFLPPPPRPDMISLYDIQGRASGPVSLQITGKDAMELITQPRGYLHLGDFASGNADASLHIVGHGKKAFTTVERLHAETADGVFDLNGTVDEQEQQHFTIHGYGVSLKHFASLGGLTDIDGLGYLSGTLSGPASSPTFTGDFHAVNGHFATRPFTDLSGSVEAVLSETPDITLSKLRLISGESRIELASTLHITSATTWQADGTATLPRTSLAALAKTIGIPLPLDGVVEGEARLTHLPDAPQGSGRLVVTHPVLHLGENAVEFDSATIPFTLKGRTLTLDDAMLVYQGNAITVSGALSLDAATPENEQLSLRISAPNINIDSLVTPMTTGAGVTPIRYTGGNLLLPFDIGGKLAVDATITACLTPVGKETPDQTVARTLRIEATARAGQTLEIAGVPFKDGEVAAQYDGARQLLTLRRCTLTRQDSGHDYTLALVKDGTFRLDSQDIDVGFTLTAADKHAGADLEQLRQDALDMSANLGTLPGIVQAVSALRSTPTPFGGAANLTLTVGGSLDHPVAHADITLRDLQVGGNPLPDVDGNIGFDTATREISFEKLSLRGGADHAATASLTGTITLPVKDAQGKEIKPGPMKLEFDAQNVDPSEVGRWLHLPALQGITGKTTIFASIPDTSTTAHPNVEASIEIEKLALNGVPFKSLSAYVTMDDAGIWIGHWVEPNTAPSPDGQTPVRFAGREIMPDAASTLEFTSASGNKIEPLELYGYLPFRWHGSLHPEMPLDEPLLFYARLPKQGLEVVRAYAPTLPAGDGTVDGDLTIGGSLRQLVVQSGAFHAHVNEMALGWNDPDLPDLIRDGVVDLAFRSQQENGHTISIVDLRDLSGIYTRADYGKAKPKKEFFVLRWLRMLQGKNANRATFTPGSIVARGGDDYAIRIDLEKLFTANGTLIPLQEIPDRLDYNIYAKILRTPMVVPAPSHKSNLFQGTVTSYLHLGNRTDTGRPLLEGNAYLEGSRLNFGAEQTEPAAVGIAPAYPLDPELKIGVWLGPGNVFTMGPNNPLFNSSVSATLPFMRTKLPFPFSPGDQQYLEMNVNAKPPMNTNDLLHLGGYADAWSRMNFADPHLDLGTVGWVEGTLAHPVLAGHAVMTPNKSTISLPGAVLTVSSAIADARLPFAPTGPDDQPRLLIQAKATGSIEGYGVEGTVDGDLLKQERGALGNPLETDSSSTDQRKLPITFVTTSTPAGAAPLSSDEIYSRLLGVTTLLSALERRDPNDPWAPVRVKAGELLIRELTGKWASQSNILDTVSISLDPSRAPEATLITKEFVNSRLGALRLGLTTTFDTPQTWQTWVDYRLPNASLLHAVSLRDFSLSASLNDRREHSVSLQWRREF